MSRYLETKTNVMAWLHDEPVMWVEGWVGGGWVGPIGCCSIQRATWSSTKMVSNYKRLGKHPVQKTDNSFLCYFYEFEDGINSTPYRPVSWDNSKKENSHHSRRRCTRAKEKLVKRPLQLQDVIWVCKHATLPIGSLQLRFSLDLSSYQVMFSLRHSRQPSDLSS